jgi:hypothetical protein
MRHTQKIFFLFIFNLFLLNLVLTTSSAFTSDSYSQKGGDEIIWDIKEADTNYVLILRTGDHVKVAITKTNTTKLNSVQYDTLYGLCYKKSISDEDWNLFLTSTPYLFGGYNSSYGIFPSFSTVPLEAAGKSVIIIPHNETAVQEMLTPYYSLWPIDDYTWTSGPNGYDGHAVGWQGSATGDPGMDKIELQFNADGILQFLKWFIGQGGSWDLVYYVLFLQSTSRIPGFMLFPLLTALITFTAIYVFLKHRNGLNEN